MSKDKQNRPDVNVRGAAAAPKRVRKNFPGPRGAQSPLRVAFDRAAHAEIIAHAKSSLDAEVCGVLAGQICEDDEGLFVHVQAAVRGTAASEGSTHVTFTQETWTIIHETMDRDHPKLRMVGWYHTHPGFGVEFSEMDLFIQRNFFSGEAQIALVTDPLSGASAVITSLPDEGITYLPNYWVDGRQQTSVVPASQSASSVPVEKTGVASSSSLQTLETRVEQLTQALDGVRSDFYKMLMFCGCVVCVAVIVAVGYFIRSMFVARNEPPHLNSFMPLPVQIGDKKVLLGVNIVSWDVPPELNAMLLEEIKEHEEAARLAAEKAAKENGGKPPENTVPSQPPPQGPAPSVPGGAAPSAAPPASPPAPAPGS